MALVLYVYSAAIPAGAQTATDYDIDGDNLADWVLMGVMGGLVGYVRQAAGSKRGMITASYAAPPAEWAAPKLAPATNSHRIRTSPPMA